MGGFLSSIAPAVISGVGNFLGANKQAKAQKQTNREDRAFQEKWNQQGQANFERQQTQMIQDRVRDARQAGIGPLASLGLPGAQAPSFSMAPGRAAGFSRTGAAFSEIGEAITKIQMAREAAALKTERATAQKQQAETNAVKTQTMLAQQELMRRQAQLYGAQAAALAEQKPPGKPPRKGIYAPYYDNSAELQELYPEGVVMIPTSEYAEGVEGLGALGTAVYGNTLGRFRGRPSGKPPQRTKRRGSRPYNATRGR